ncbi:hypothetical protein [Zophobihabitans entericus]|uniref:Uncharacterized protein n=1 Tax=Zophobihabitans entericus TaxID=1635327 RepID=A0A6G9IEZ7_9GAMM|nr:hypothetical protein [Zophobihabitans entericus]QIQ22170.1 hypothetical protein IPMB12_11020 [Zophobihabitans entericus]
MERPQLEIDLEHQQLQRLLQENERQLEFERLVQQKLPEAEENVQEQLKKQKNPLKEFTEEEQKVLTKALSKKVAAKGHGYEVIYIAPYKDKDKDSHLIAYFDKNRPPAHINIQKTLREHQLEQQALLANQQQLEQNSVQSDDQIKPDIKSIAPDTILEVEQEKTQRSVIAQQGDSAIKIAHKLDSENPNQALGHLYQSGQVKDIKLKDEHQHVIPNVKPNKEYTYDPELYNNQEKQLNDKIARNIMSQQTQVNEQIDRINERIREQLKQDEINQSLLVKQQQQDEKISNLDKESLFNKQVSVQNMLALKVDTLSSISTRYTGNCNAKNPYKYDTPEFWIQEWVGNSTSWQQAHHDHYYNKMQQLTPAKTQAEHYIFARAIQSDPTAGIVRYTYSLTGAVSAWGYYGMKKVGSFNDASAADIEQAKWGTKGWFDGLPTTRGEKYAIIKTIPGECIKYK